MENELIVLTVLIMLYIIMVFGIVYWLSLNIDEKQNHIKKTARGLKNVLKEYDKEEMVDIQKVSDDVKLLYDEYIQELPNVKKIFPNIIVWLDSILLQLSLERKRVQPLEKYYKLLKNVRDFLNTNNPYSNCTQYQQGILKDINGLKSEHNIMIVDNIIGRTESEFIRLENNIKKNERSNKLSIMIGVVGIIISIILAIIKF
ncbi:hypothetical protein [Dorea formicigenerans]|uniref:Uncharacterized protein n=1 Tax=Dorea formicigenerans TaxID=39486 RepID=A0A412EXN4_9FIRM|nr:hypothetical protein [Dorea formicigenerans]RGR56122.1 hypothetical protein DWY33_13085 [Dorea formicigenerans]